jgi:PKD repeat protein
VKTKKKDSNLRELFRQKLENSEVTPDAAVKSKLMRKVARKEFMRFNPARINIYYVGVLIVAAVTTSLMIFTNAKDTRSNDADKSLNTVISPDTLYISESQVLTPVRNKTGKIVKNTESHFSSTLTDSHKKVLTSSTVRNDSDRINTFIPVNVANSISRKRIFIDSGAVNNKLQSGYTTGDNMISPVASAGCAPFKIRFYNKAVSFDSCRWIFGDGGYSNEKDPEWIFDVAGEYKVKLMVFDQDGKSSVSTATVIVNSRPQAHFEISPSKAILPNDEIRFLNYSVNAVKFMWDFGDGSTSDLFEPVHTYSKFSSYDVRLVVYSDLGCSDSLVVHNAFAESGYSIDFPNAFIPNPQGPTGGYYSTKSDEIAQVFHPSFSGVTEYHLKIFSKLGIPIFESSDVNIGWDGYNKGQLCEPGVYIWKVRGRFRNGDQFTKMGDVTLLKN